MNAFRNLKRISSTSLKKRDKDVLLLCKVIKNMLENDVVGYNDLARLKEYKDAMRKLSKPINILSIPQRRRIINQQGSGFLPVLLPIAISALWNILSQK